VTGCFFFGLAEERKRRARQEWLVHAERGWGLDGT